LKANFANFSWTVLFSLALIMLSFPILAWGLFDYQMGGDGWRQGDWLINLGSGFVRRGIMGEAFILVSDLTGANLLVVVQVFQVLLFVALILVIWTIGLMHSNRRILLFLAASPAFFLIFWAGDLQGTMRKELFGLLALALLTLSSVKSARSSVYAMLAVMLFTLGSIGNILHSLMAGSMIAGLYLSREGGQISGRLFGILAGFSLAMAVLWLGLAIWFREVPELAGMCDRLLARGFQESFCNDALRRLVAGEVDPLSGVAQRLTPIALTVYFALVGLSLVPVVLSFFVFRERRLLTILLIVTFVPMLPLYVVALDWGRWLSISFTSYIFLLIQAHATGRLSVVSLPSPRLVFSLIVLALVISPAHSIGLLPASAVQSFLLTVAAFL